jgi:SNF2 family DNA or RNA helicase
MVIQKNRGLNFKNYNNTLMQLRKVCNHPYLFDGVEPEDADEFGEHVIEASGKLKIVDQIMKKNVKNGD